MKTTKRVVNCTGKKAPRAVAALAHNSRVICTVQRKLHIIVLHYIAYDMGIAHRLTIRRK